MAFEDLRTFFEDFIDLPIGGKVYRIPGPSAELGVWIQATWATAIKLHLELDITEKDVAKLQLDDDSEVALYRRWFPDVYDQMVTDQVGWDEINLVGKTAFVWVGSGEKELAERFWRAGGDPKASALANRQTRRGKALTRTDGATTTKRPASTSITKSAGKKASTPR